MRGLMQEKLCLTLGRCLVVFSFRCLLLDGTELPTNGFRDPGVEYLGGYLAGFMHGCEHVIGGLQGITRASQVLRPIRHFLRQYLTADDHALVADVDSGAGDELGNLDGEFAAERTATRVL